MDGWLLAAYEFGPPALRALFVAVATYIAVRVARSSFNYTARRADVTARLLIGRIITTVIVGIGVATILDTIGVPLTTFVTVLGVAGLGISLAMQDILKSFVAGTYLLFERPFRIGDEISVKDQRGIVEHIGIRTTQLRNADNVQIIIPNSVMFAEMVANRTNERKPEPADRPAEAAATAAPAGAASIPAAPASSPEVQTPAPAAPASAPPAPSETPTSRA
ncbi:MAG: mechanosensitive ion channel [Chloroflexi bacterium]|nr:mechanosensitive ion channel [Chloroflexota bacterium]